MVGNAVVQLARYIFLSRQIQSPAKKSTLLYFLPRPFLYPHGP